MSVFKSSLQRKIFIDKKIRERAYPTATSLARDYESEFGKKIDPRTIASDIADLRQKYAAPIRYDAKNRGYFYADKLYRLDVLVGEHNSDYLPELSQKQTHSANLPEWKKKILVSLMNDSLTVLREGKLSKHDFSDERVTILPSTDASDASQLIEKTCLEALKNSLPVQITLCSDKDSEVFTFYPLHVICEGEQRLFFGKRYFDNLRDIDYCLVNLSAIAAIDLLKATDDFLVSDYAIYVQSTGNDDIEIILTKRAVEKKDEEHIFIFGLDIYSTEKIPEYYLLAHTELF